VNRYSPRTPQVASKEPIELQNIQSSICSSGSGILFFAERKEKEKPAFYQRKVAATCSHCSGYPTSFLHYVSVPGCVANIAGICRGRSGTTLVSTMSRALSANNWPPVQVKDWASRTGQSTHYSAYCKLKNWGSVLVGRVLEFGKLIAIFADRCSPATCASNSDDSHTATSPESRGLRHGVLASEN
jgi:hypothetical protein